MIFEKAEMSQLGILRKIAYHSEKYWGFDDGFMETFEMKFNISEHFMEKHPVYVGMEENQPVCFWGAIPSGSKCELEFFYVDTTCIRKGYGAAMWQHFTSWCRQNRIEVIGEDKQCL